MTSEMLTPAAAARTLTISRCWAEVELDQADPTLSLNPPVDILWLGVDRRRKVPLIWDNSRILERLLARSLEALSVSGVKMIRYCPARMLALRGNVGWVG